MNEIVIQAKNLSKSFAGRPAVINFAITVRKGEIWGFLGPNGSGKTTTLRMLCGLLTPDTCEGTCLGFDILTQSYEIKRRIGYMTQSFSLYQDLTVYENLDFIARAFEVADRENKIAYFMQFFNLSSHQNKIAEHLSGGMRQRLALAGCLLHSPQLLLLDEPTAGVDPKARREFWDEIHKLSQQGITTLVSTHYMDEAERCSKLVYLSFGKVLAKGEAEEIIQQSKLYTFEVESENLFATEEMLKDQKGVDQVAFFGKKLHVSGTNETLLEEALAKFGDGLQARQIIPSLEDAFISFVQKAKEEK